MFDNKELAMLHSCVLAGIEENNKTIASLDDPRMIKHAVLYDKELHALREKVEVELRR